MARRDQRFQTLLDDLRRQVGNAFGPGESLPSTRDLASMHGVGTTTIQRALKQLKIEGCVTAVANVGWFRSSDHRAKAADSSVRKSKRATLSVGLMTRRSAEELKDLEIYSALLDEAKRRGIKIVAIPNRHVFRTTLERNRIELSRVPWNTFDVGLLVEAEDTIFLRDPALLERKVLAVDQDASAYGIDSVAFADAQGGALAARHLLELGHTHFAVTEEFNDPGYPADPARSARQQGFEAAIRDAGGVLQPKWRLPIYRRGNPTWNKGGVEQTDPKQLVKETVAAWVGAAASHRPTALFACAQGPLIEGGLLDELAKHGIRVPRDLSIVAVTLRGKFWGGSEPVIHDVRLTCIDFDLDALARRAFDAAAEIALEKRKTGSRLNRLPKVWLAPAMLAAGRSTAPPR